MAQNKQYGSNIKYVFDLNTGNECHIKNATSTIFQLQCTSWWGKNNFHWDDDEVHVVLDQHA
jgi:hypothetical protein